MLMGWIKVHRILLNKPIWLKSTPEQKTILITLLMLANHDESEWEWMGNKFKVEPGQFITSLESIKLYCGKGITIQNIRSALKRFEKLEFLTNKSTKTGRMITICNWDSYQITKDEHNNEANKQVTKTQQRGNKEVTTNKNNKKEKNDNNQRTYIGDFINGFNIIKNSKFKKTEKVKHQLNARLKEGYSIEEILTATKACFNDEWHKKNPKYLTPEFITRSDKLQKYLNDARIQDNQGKSEQYKSNFNPATGKWRES